MDGPVHHGPVANHTGITNGGSEHVLVNGHNSSSDETKRSKEGSSSKHHGSSKHSGSSSSHNSKSKHGSSHSGSSLNHSSKSKESSSSSGVPKESSSSSSKHRDDKHKHSSSSSKSKDSRSKSSSSSKHKESSRSSSSKPKDGSSSSSSSKHKDKQSSDSSKHKDKHKSSHKESERRSSSSTLKVENIKQEPKDSALDFKVKSETITIKTSVKDEPIGDEEMPLNVSTNSIKSEPPKRKFVPSDDEDDVPLSMRMAHVKRQKISASHAKSKHVDSDDEDDIPLSVRTQKIKKEKHKKEHDISSKVKKKVTNTSSESVSPKKKVKKEEPEDHVWKWWEEEKKEEGVKWRYLEHRGPLFSPSYEPLPKSVHFKYDGSVMKLRPETEEVAGFYARFIEHDYTTKPAFNQNFVKDWRKVMSSEERQTITDLSKCNFRELFNHYQQVSEDRKNRSKEQKKKLKEENEAIQNEYGFCTMDGYKQKIGNFRIEPPGLFRGRGDHPKMGMLKKRLMPEDVMINCSKDSEFPKPPPGHKWKEVRHDNSVTWLASWTENIQGQNKYVMLNPSSKLKGEKDWQKYETARKLKNHVERIRAVYREDWKSKEMKTRQRAVALYFIDKLALRAGNEKEEGETADTVGCCSLRVEHIKLHEEVDGQECVVEFDFLGKDSIRYQNRVPVEKRVFKNLQRFMENKRKEDDLFDRLNTSILNKHLQDLMEGLTAKVFRTFNASKTLQDQLSLLTKAEDPITAKILSYNRANRAVALLCNHQRAAPKTFGQQMDRLTEKIKEKKLVIKAAKKDMKVAKHEYKDTGSQGKGNLYEKKKKSVQRLEEQLTKLEVQATDKEENKEIALGTSKLNYLDPRITVAWCKKWDVPIEKIYNKTQRDKFRWAIDMATPDYEF
ncbi:PREDICTED: DNA topoisomerase I, mitochondrial-like [Priapulus caudatus]|uniref:DNA topoisomerase I n=1 Tax=Priapulus caudatus TaxID=37621 RepID=A0ABM1F404_PRICU|nr:PREDICTED: DNA topoisomerase I, mitochondrial-like [Priapulus caudatus]